MPKGRSYSTGTNRSGTKRKRIMIKYKTADGPEAGCNQRERPLGEKQTGSNVQLLSDKGKDMNSDTDVVIEDGG